MNRVCVREKLWEKERKREREREKGRKTEWKREAEKGPKGGWMRWSFLSEGCLYETQWSSVPQRIPPQSQFSSVYMYPSLKLSKAIAPEIVLFSPPLWLSQCFFHSVCVCVCVRERECVSVSAGQLTVGSMNICSLAGSTCPAALMISIFVYWTSQIHLSHCFWWHI